MFKLIGLQIATTLLLVNFCFFFQAEDGIRDYKVTGVQTCALPIWLFNALAVNALNALMGSVGTPGGVFFMQGGAQEDIAGGPRSANATARSLNDRPPLQEELRDAQVLLIDGANPVYAAPRAWKVRETLTQLPYIVSFGNFIDETSALVDLILPDHSFLESWVQSMPESGAKTAIVSMAAPVMQPLHETRASGGVILDVARRLRKPLELPWKTVDTI